VSLRGTDINLAPLADAVAEPKLLDEDLFDTAEVFFG
jgi:ATP-dependent phosphofructokinase / diphosphate-dependent phosphofructokinase